MTDFDDISFRFDTERNFNFRVAVFLHCENKVLLHKPNGTEFWNLVGGRVKFKEGTLHAIKRELEEELGYTFEDFKLRRIHENFFLWQQHTKITELLFVYDLEISPLHPLYKNNRFEHDNTEFEWFQKDKVTEYEVFCLPKQIYEMVKEKEWQLSHSQKNEY